VLLREEHDAQAAVTREKLSVGAVLEGQVRSITDFGAFIDLGGIDGLVHVTEISRRRVAHAKDVLTVGQTVSVKVTKIEQDGKRISLSMKELEKDPWAGITERLAAGAPFTGTVARHADFGLFVEVEPGVDGLVHVSQLPPGVGIKDASVAPGQAVKGWVREVDAEARRLSLTLRETAVRDPWSEIDAHVKEGAVVKGEVENVAPFGVFVAIEGGFTGLIPNSETGLPHGTPATKSFAPGQKVEVKVIGVDKERKRISLSASGARDEAERGEIRKYREDSARSEKDKAPAITGFGNALLAAMNTPKKPRRSK
jgi:small subunit ribosomal protein S1